MKQAPSGRPLHDLARTVWINETALSTTLNASRWPTVSLTTVVGSARLRSGSGSILGAGGTLRNREAPITAVGRKTHRSDAGLAGPTDTPPPCAPRAACRGDQPD